ncbi:MAG: hypothetical protein G01um10145_235 [Microgenomates group bacterium Gr01-1014_5]|nr:MAG: hypothetical protein G01um10145_235 [Microgenomates group bacterium Gr01-1014_5]
MIDNLIDQSILELDMSEDSGDHQIETRHTLPTGELPSLSLITSLRKFNRPKGEWNGTINLRGLEVKVSIHLFDTGFPVHTRIDVKQGESHENWRMIETRNAMKLELTSASPATIIAPDIAEPEERFSGVGADIALKRPRKLRKPLMVGDIDFGRSNITGSGLHSVRKVIAELAEMASALRLAA